MVSSCFLWFKDTKMKANHNLQSFIFASHCAVSYGSKILKWKQITTISRAGTSLYSCFLWFKDTKMKANHNRKSIKDAADSAVSYGSKILKWKQITTHGYTVRIDFSCFLWFKDTKMKANHNEPSKKFHCYEAVSYGSKILKWKQITTLQL